METYRGERGPAAGPHHDRILSLRASLADSRAHLSLLNLVLSTQTQRPPEADRVASALGHVTAAVTDLDHLLTGG